MDRAACPPPKLLAGDRRFDWRQSQTSMRSRKSQPFATTPWSRGVSPVMKVAWTLQVTAGVTVASGRTAPAAASRARFGVRSRGAWA
jgi:hypothetical protein